jgi:predicted nucleic acid-binding protein
MMIADTSVWIEFLKGRADYQILDTLLNEGRVFAIECIFGELLQGARTADEVEIVKGYWENLPKVNEDSIWIRAGELSFDGKYFSKGIGLLDLAILAAARMNGLRIWTLDKKLKGILKQSELYTPLE